MTLVNLGEPMREQGRFLQEVSGLCRRSQHGCRKQALGPCLARWAPGTDPEDGLLGFLAT